MTYEAGPTGFGLARFLPLPWGHAWLRRRRSCNGPWGDRVKTDARDAELLARLLKLDEIVEVVVPTWLRRPPGTWSGPVRMSAVI